MRRTRKRLGLAACLAGLAISGCGDTHPPREQIQIEKTRPLPEIAANDQNFSSYKPANPYQEVAANAMSRTIFEAAGPGGYRVEVRDLRVDAKKTAENISFPGAAFLQVIQGAGAVATGGKRQELAGSTSLSIPQGQTVALEATSDQPLILRVRLVRAE
jgi:quercetin dioxygenase-like cupin family protein